MIIQFNDKLLHVKSEPASLEEAAVIIKLLEEELNAISKSEIPGIGLAAIQIGIPKQVAIIRINDNTKVDLVNPEISNKKNKYIFKNEGCLSYPGVFKNTIRYDEIYVEKNLISPHSFSATGLLAVAIQHEKDHMDGIVINDLSSLKMKIRPNEPCPCGKINVLGKINKYKKCCGVRK